jgi:hypothetical protein
MSRLPCAGRRSWAGDVRALHRALGGMAQLAGLYAMGGVVAGPLQVGATYATSATDLSLDDAMLTLSVLVTQLRLAKVFVIEYGPLNIQLTGRFGFVQFTGKIRAVLNEPIHVVLHADYHR